MKLTISDYVYKPPAKSVLNGPKLARIRLSFARDLQNRASFSPDQKNSCKQCCNPVTDLNGSVLTGCTGKKFVRSKICPEPCKPCLKTLNNLEIHHGMKLCS